MSANPSLDPVLDRPKGVLDPIAARAKFRLARYLPEPILSPFLDHYWVVQWDLGDDAPYLQRTLPYPCVNMVFDAGRTAIFGVIRGAFEYTLVGRGRVLGVRFRPGAFRGFLGRPVRTLVDRQLKLSALFDCDDFQAEQAVLSANDDAGMIAAASDLLLRHLPRPDPQVERIHHLLTAAEQARDLTSVGQLAERASTSVRLLQRMFGEYVGVSPKWVIKRYRLHDAADRLACGEAIDLAAMAHDLGYYDQSHFTRDFRLFVGKSPAQYMRTLGRPLDALVRHG